MPQLAVGDTAPDFTLPDAAGADVSLTTLRRGAEHGVVVNPLLADGYPSIGCEPCTRRVPPGEDPRSGRWAGFTKTECGIHL